MTMQIHVARNSAQLGVFSAEDITAGLASQRFLASDLGWREGMSAWTPLGDWAEFRGVGVPPSPSSHSTSAAEAGASLAMPSWERGSSFANHWATIREVALDPVRTFSNMRDGGFARPISFTYWSLVPAWICGSLLYGVLLPFFVTVGKGAAGPGDPVMKWLSEVGAVGAAGIISLGLGIFLLLVPFINFVGAAFTHVLLLPWKPAGGYAQTYRANAYAYGAFMPFVFIPCLNYVAAPWQMVAAVIAHSQVHRIAWWKVVLSLIVVPCCCVCGLYASLIGTVIGAAGKFSR